MREEKPRRLHFNLNNQPEPANTPEIQNIEKLNRERANLISAKSLLVFLRNTKDKGSDFQKKILADVFKKKDK